MVFRVDREGRMFLFCSYGVKAPKPPFQAALVAHPGERRVLYANGVTVAWIYCRDDEQRYSFGASKLTRAFLSS